MSGSRVLIKDAAQKVRPFCGLDQVLQTSNAAPWADILKIEHQRVPPGDIVDSAPRDLLIVQRLNSSKHIDYRIVGERWKRKLICQGDFALVGARVIFSMHWNDAAEVLVLSVDPKFISRVIAEDCGCGHIEFTNPQAFQDAQMEHIVATLHAELEQACPGGRLFGESLATALVVHLARRYSVFRVEAPECRGGLPAARLRRVIDYVHAHLIEDTSLRQLAIAANFSPHHFASLFKGSTGLTPHQYVLQQKIELAKRLLLDARYSLTDVAQQAGFQTQSHFSTTFHKMMGLSPGDYRRGL